MNKILHTKFGTAKLQKNGYYFITSRKEGNNAKRLHRLIWEDFYGCEVPEGYVIHHRDHNPLNNCILNLQLMRREDHMSLHNKGKTLSQKKGENSHNWKNYARIIKDGFKNNGKQIYTIRFNGKNIKKSISISKLLDWFGENYPNEYLYFGDKLD